MPPLSSHSIGRTNPAFTDAGASLKIVAPKVDGAKLADRPAWASGRADSKARYATLLDSSRDLLVGMVEFQQVCRRYERFEPYGQHVSTGWVDEYDIEVRECLAAFFHELHVRRCVTSLRFENGLDCCSMALDPEAA